MRQVLIVDDDTIVRITLRSLIDWERFGYQVAADAVHGKQALQYLDTCPVDLVITDMKMPVMDGLTLIDAIHKKGLYPQILVLSGYDEFKLVREAFCLGASDYLLKTDLEAQLLEKALERLEEERKRRQDKGPDRGQNGLDKGPDRGQDRGPGSAGQMDKDRTAPRRHGREGMQKADLLTDMAMGRRPLDLSMFNGAYVVVRFEIEDYSRHGARFSYDLEEGLIRPFLSLAYQIPRVAARCVLGCLSPSQYIMLYQVADSRVYQENVCSTCRQLCSVWNNYMNLPVAVGASSLEMDSEAFWERMEEAGRQLKLRYLKGRAKTCVPWDREQVDYDQVMAVGEQYERLLRGLMICDELAVEEEKSRLFTALYAMDLGQAKALCLCLLGSLAWKMEEDHDDIRSLFSEEIDLYKKLERFEEIRGLELWLGNYFRWFFDHQSHKQARSQEDLMIRAKRFILDNFANPELTLGSVAGYVGLNEKYFSTKFTKEEGMTFTNYLTEVRIRKARELMDKTSLKVYEISQSVGYNSVEHFTRVFKRICKVSPGSYRKSGEET